MSEPTGRGGVKTLAIRLPDELHGQLVLIASLEGLSLTDTIRQAILDLIERKRGDGDLADQAAKALEAMEQETQARRLALQALLGPSGQQTGQQAPADQAGSARGRARRGDAAS
jgi:predicted DNA-binding protein